MISFGETTFSCSAAVPVTILKVDPGGYSPVIALLSIGWYGFSLITFQSFVDMPLTKRFGSKDGRLTRASTSPVCGFMTTAAAALAPMAESC